MVTFRMGNWGKGGGGAWVSGCREVWQGRAGLPHLGAGLEQVSLLAVVGGRALVLSRAGDAESCAGPASVQGAAHAGRSAPQGKAGRSGSALHQPWSRTQHAALDGAVGLAGALGVDLVLLAIVEEGDDADAVGVERGGAAGTCREGKVPCTPRRLPPLQAGHAPVVGEIEVLLGDRVASLHLALRGVEGAADVCKRRQAAGGCGVAVGSQGWLHRTHCRCRRSGHPGSRPCAG